MGAKKFALIPFMNCAMISGDGRYSPYTLWSVSFFWYERVRLTNKGIREVYLVRWVMKGIRFLRTG